MSRNSENALILRSQKFQRLVIIRNRTRLTLSALALSCHAFFVGGIAFYRDFFAQPLVSDGIITVGIAATIAVIFSMIFLEWVYIFVSEKWFTPMQRDVLASQHSGVNDQEGKRNG